MLWMKICKNGKKISLLLASIFLFSAVEGVAKSPSYYLENRLDKTNGRYGTFTKALELLNKRKIKTIVETGTARCGDSNFDGDGGSTIIFGHWAMDHDAVMYSVDVSPSHIALARQASKKYLTHLFFVEEDSISFLQNFPSTIDFLYLDSYDYDENDPLPPQMHNLHEVMAAYDKLTDHSIIMIDDCNIPGGGKGKLAIEFLLKKGWKLHANRHQVILLKTKA